MSNSNSAIVGSWYPSAEGRDTVVTFLPDGTFLLAAQGAPEASGRSGLEWGTYSWNPSTGALGYQILIDTNGDWGLSGSGVTRATISGDTATINPADEEGPVTLERLPVSASSLVGSWYAEPAPSSGGTDQIVFNFFDDGTFLFADKGTVARDPNGTSGIEWGTYTWNAATGAFNPQVLINTDGQWGVSHEAPQKVMLNGDTVDIDGFIVHRTPSGSPTTGTAGAESLSGTSAAERFTGLGGNDSIVGGGGMDTAVYSGPRSQFSITPDGAGFLVQDGSGREGLDSLAGVERLVFADGKLALDLTGHAGSVARVLGAVLGPDAVHNPQLVGIGLQLMDAGMSYASLMEAALGVVLPGGTHSQIVDLLFTNLARVHPTAEQAAVFVSLLDSHAMTPTQLAVAAADTPINAANIGLVGLASTGLAYA